MIANDEQQRAFEEAGAQILAVAEAEALKYTPADLSPLERAMNVAECAVQVLLGVMSKHGYDSACAVYGVGMALGTVAGQVAQRDRKELANALNNGYRRALVATLNDFQPKGRG